MDEAFVDYSLIVLKFYAVCRRPTASTHFYVVILSKVTAQGMVYIVILSKVTAQGMVLRCKPPKM